MVNVEVAKDGRVIDNRSFSEELWHSISLRGKEPIYAEMARDGYSICTSISRPYLFGEMPRTDAMVSFNGIPIHYRTYHCGTAVIMVTQPEIGVDVAHEEKPERTERDSMMDWMMGRAEW